MSGSSTCRSCGRPIVWGETEAGKKIPMDPEPSIDGNLTRTASTVDGRIHYLIKYYKRARETPGVTTYKSHFATCPDAKNFRRPR